MKTAKELELDMHRKFLHWYRDKRMGVTANEFYEAHQLWSEAVLREAATREAQGPTLEGLIRANQELIGHIIRREAEEEKAAAKEKKPVPMERKKGVDAWGGVWVSVRDNASLNPAWPGWYVTKSTDCFGIVASWWSGQHWYENDRDGNRRNAVTEYYLPFAPPQPVDEIIAGLRSRFDEVNQKLKKLLEEKGAS